MSMPCREYDPSWTHGLNEACGASVISAMMGSDEYIGVNGHGGGVVAHELLGCEAGVRRISFVPTYRVAANQDRLTGILNSDAVYCRR